MRPRVLLLGGALLASCVLVYTFLAEDGLRSKARLTQERAALAGRVRAQEAENAALATQARALQDSEEGNPVLEDAVRTELGYVKKDEFIILMDEES